VGALILAGCGNPTPEERARIEKQRTAEVLEYLHAAYDEQFEVVRVRWTGPDMFGKIGFGGVILRPASSQDPLDYFDAYQVGSVSEGTRRWVDNYLCVSSWRTYATMVSDRVSEVFPEHRVIVWLEMYTDEFLSANDGVMTTEEYVEFVHREGRVDVLLGVPVPAGTVDEDLTDHVKQVTSLLEDLPAWRLYVHLVAYESGVAYEEGVAQFSNA
jgi:hypothetical protein